MKITTDNFRRTLILFREIYCLKVKEIAELCGVDSTTINKLERGICSPSVEMLKKMVAEFQISAVCFMQVVYSQKTLTNSQILIRLRPERASETINPNLSSARVAKLVRLLKNTPYYNATSNNTMARSKIIYSQVQRIEKLECIPGIDTIHHLCILYGISVDKFLNYAKQTSKLTWMDAAIFIAGDFESIQVEIKRR